MSKFGLQVDETTKLKHDPNRNLSIDAKIRAENEENEKNIYDIQEAGQDDRKKAIKAVESQVKEESAKEQKIQDDILNHLDHKKRFIYGYKIELAEALGRLLELLDWIKGWQAQVIVTDGSPITIRGKGFQTKDGLLVVVLPPDGRMFHQGVLITQEPVLDYAALHALAIQVENTLDREKGLLLDNITNEPKSSIVDSHGNPIASNRQTESDPHGQSSIPTVS